MNYEVNHCKLKTRARTNWHHTRPRKTGLIRSVVYTCRRYLILFRISLINMIVEDKSADPYSNLAPPVLLTVDFFIDEKSDRAYVT